MLEPVNRWRPVTTEYQEELAPPKRRSFRDRIWKRRGGKGEPTPAQEEMPAGVLGVTWFYLLNAAAYFLSGSVLLSFPLSDFAYKVMRHGHVLVPFPVHPLEDVPLVNVLAESLFIMAVVSAALAVLWMTRSSAAGWVTLLYAAGWLVRNALDLFAGRVGLHFAPLSPGELKLLLLDSFAEALIFLYLVFSLRGPREPSEPPRLRS
jgi:hypothetical protein